MRVGMFVLSAAVLVLIVGMAAADDSGNESGAFVSPFGAKVRLLQLEGALDRNIAVGDAVVAAIRSANASADTGSLEAILAEMTALRAEADSAAADPGSGEEAARDFVDMKDDARDMSKEFRETARGMLAPGEFASLQGSVGNITRDERQDLKGRIRDVRLGYNAERVEALLSAMGISDPGLVDRVRSGDATLGDVRSAIKDAEGNMTAQERRQANLALKEQLSKANVFMRAVADKVRFKQLERVQDRLERRLDEADRLNVSDGARLRLENRSAWVADRMDKVKERFDQRVGRIENLTQKKEENVDKLIGKLENRSDKLEGRLTDKLEGNLTDDVRDRVEGRLDRLENKTEERMDRLEERKEKIEDKGQALIDRLGNVGGKGNGGG